LCRLLRGCRKRYMHFMEEGLIRSSMKYIPNKDYGMPKFM
jgi:hypothetical protein